MESQQNNIKTGPKDVFLQLLNLAVFYVSTVSFIALWFQYINVLVPDPLKFNYQSILDVILWSTSVLVVAFPVYIGSSWFMGKDFLTAPQKRESKFRKWLIYFTLFVSSVTIIVDIIMLIYNFLKGDLTLHFFLKIFVVLAAAAAVFGYYLWELKRDDGDKSRKISKTVALASSAAILASVISGFFIVGTPAQQRAYRFDEQRVNDLQTIQGQIVYNHWTQKGKLPERLDDLKDDISGFQPPQDPETGLPYGYRIIDSENFELCADFKTSSEKFTGKEYLRSPATPHYDPYYGQNWNHGAERTCFTRKIDPEIYKVKESIPLPR